MSASTTKSDAGPAAPTTMPAKGSTRLLRDCKNLAQAFETTELRNLIAQAIPEHIMTPDAMLRTWVQAASRTPLIYEADFRQALGCFQSLAYLGLVPNTPLQHAHIIPFKRKAWNPKTRQRDIETVEIQVIIGYPGYIELADRSEAVRTLHADVVHNRVLERFSYSYGSNQHLEHGEKPVGYEPTGDPEYAYAWIRRTSGEEQFEVMVWKEVERIRNRSQAFRTADAARDEAESKGKRPPPAWSEAPWVRDGWEMAKKTAIRRLMKVVPKAPYLRAAAALEDSQERSRLDWGPVIDGTATPLDTGVPEAKDDPPPPDPGAAFGTRGTGGTAEDTADDEGSDGVSRETLPPFEAALVDQWGEPSEQIYTDRVEYARALATAWRSAKPEEREALIGHNADAIDDAKLDLAAAKVLFDPLSDEAVGTQPPAVIAVPLEKGKPVWAGYIRALKEALSAERHLVTWAETQRATILGAPVGTRAVATAAIREAFVANGIIIPQWLQARQPPPPTNGSAKSGADKPAAKPLPLDEQWALAAIAELRTLDRAKAMQWATREKGVMLRLKREAPGIFDRVDDVLGERIGTKPPPDDDEPPPNLAA